MAWRLFCPQPSSQVSIFLALFIFWVLLEIPAPLHQLWMITGLEDAENLPQDAATSVKPPTPLSLLPQPLPPGIQKVNPSSYLVARWSEGSFPPLVTRWSRLSLKMHTEGMRNS